MLTKDFAYNLPIENIARYPTEKRSGSRLLVLDKNTGAVQDKIFSDVVDFLRPGDLLVVNDSKVMHARLFGQKQTGGKVEVLIEKILEPNVAWAFVKSSKSPGANSQLILAGKIVCKVLEHNYDKGLFLLEFQDDIKPILEQYGAVPLPPYMERAAEITDTERYQTVYARAPGSIAAPTAGLHFSEELLLKVQQKGIELGRATLHVGAGTFMAVKVENIKDHKMHTEYLEVSQELCDQVRAAKLRGGRVVCVGTTSVRSLETAAKDGTLKPFAGETDIFITPGYDFKVVDCLITNFHIPESTLLMLVSALAGKDKILAAYEHAIKNKYRFYSYGDAMFIGDIC